MDALTSAALFAKVHCDSTALPHVLLTDPPAQAPRRLVAAAAALATTGAAEEAGALAEELERVEKAVARGEREGFQFSQLLTAWLNRARPEKHRIASQLLLPVVNKEKMKTNLGKKAAHYPRLHVLVP